MNYTGEQFWTDATSRIMAEPEELRPAMIDKLSGGYPAMAASFSCVC